MYCTVRKLTEFMGFTTLKFMVLRDVSHFDGKLNVLLLGSSGAFNIEVLLYRLTKCINTCGLL